MRMRDRGFRPSVESTDLPDTASRAEQELARRGFPPHERPQLRGDMVDDKGYPRMPDNLMEIGNTDLGKLYSAIELWQEYTARELVRARNMFKDATKNLRRISLDLRLNDKVGTVADRKDKAELDPQYMQEEEAEREMDALYKHLEVEMKILSGMEKTVSRIISLRGQQADVHSRGVGLRTGGWSQRVDEKGPPRSSRPPHTSKSNRPGAPRRRIK